MIKHAIIAALAVAAPLSLMAEKGFQIVKTDGETLQLANAAVEKMTFDGDDAIVTGANGESFTLSRALIRDITPVEEVATEYAVSYTAQGATVVNPYALYGVTTLIDGAYVTTTNPNVDTELTFALSGATADGSYLYNGSYKCTLKLNGVDIASQRGAAIDVQCGKRIAVVLVEGTSNNLVDYVGGSQKAAFYIKGHPEFEKGGALTVTGNVKHAISAKEYVQLKKTVGSITVLGAVSDGIHAGQYFQMNGGTLAIDNVGGDGVQAELTDDETDELNGQMIIKGGSINITVSGETADCLKADALMTISGGTINLKTTGNGIIDETAATTAAAPGGGGWGPGGGGGWGPGSDTDVETSSPKCINGNGDVVITGGELTMLSTGKGGKCISCDGSLTIGGEGMEPVLTCTTTGTAVTGSGDNLSGSPKAVKAEGDLIVNSGIISCYTSNNGGEGLESKANMVINGGTILCHTYDDALNAKVKLTVNGGYVWAWGKHNDGMDCNGTEGFEFNGGVIVSNGSSSPEEGFDCDSYSFVINGGTILGLGGATSSVTKASQPYAQTSNVSLSAGKYLSMVAADGTVILSYKVPTGSNLSRATVVSSAAEYTAGSQCKLVYGVTAVDNPAESLFDGNILLGGTITGGTTKSITPQTR